MSTPDYTSMPTQPDWIICGVQSGPEGCMIIASEQLIDGEMSAECEPLYSYGLLQPVAYTKPIFTLSVRMEHYVVVTAPTYQEALMRLFGQWEPGTTELREIQS